MKPAIVGLGLSGNAATLGNALLDRLPRETLTRLAPSLLPYPLVAGCDLQSPNEPGVGLVFPTTGVVSLVIMLANGETAEAASIGYEGVVGLGHVLDRGAITQHAVVQASGAALSLRVEPLTLEWERGGALRRTLQGYCLALMTQLAQNVACGRLHSAEERLCRWLLGMSDRLRTGEIRITHEVIARALGVRREAVTIAVHHLLMERAIRNGRGHIVILDRARLEAGACECYRLLREVLNLQPPTVTALPVASDS